MCDSTILIYNESIGFVRISEGIGDNLLPEDEEQGFVDYIMIDFIEFDGYEVEEVDGTMVLLTELYQNKFNSKEEVVQYLINACFIPNEKYMIL